MTYDLYEYITKTLWKQNMMQLVDVRKLFPKIVVGDFWGVGALVPEDPPFNLDVSPLSPTFSFFFVCLFSSQQL